MVNATVSAPQAPTWTPTRPFRFLDLPAELRNMIYPLLLEGEDPQTYSECGYRTHDPSAHPYHQVAGQYMPFTHYTLASRVDSQQKEGYTLMHASPPLLAVNKQIRVEAKSLYLSKFLTLEIHNPLSHTGPGDALYPEEIFSIKHWLATLSIAEIKGIQRVELRERVRIAHPDHAHQAREPYSDTYEERNKRARYWWRGQIAAIELFIKDNGRVLEARSRLEIVHREIVPTQRYLQQMATAKGQGEVFTGEDLISLAVWLKKTDEIPRPPGISWDGTEAYRPRWLMIGTAEEIDCSEIEEAVDWVQASLWQSIRLGFRHLVARVEISN